MPEQIPTQAPIDETAGSASHIAILVRSFEGGGGAERVMLNLAHGFAAQGRRVDLVMGRASGRFMKDWEGDFRLIDLRAPLALALLATLRRLKPNDARALLPLLISPDAPRILGGVSRLADYLDRERPQVLLCALNYPNLTGLLARQVAAHRPPVVLTVHNHISTAVAQSRRPRMVRLPELARRFFPRASAIVAVSRGVAEDTARVLGTPATSVKTIHNPVIDERLTAMAAAPTGEPWLDEPGPAVVLGVGKLKPQKDFATLIRAVAKLRQRREVRLVILGEGPEEARLRALAADVGMAEHLRLPGFVDNPYAWMARAGVFVLSSAWEGFGNVVAEALACGPPVVSTNCLSGPSEILDNGRHGRLVPVGDADAMATAIGAALDDPGDPIPRQAQAAEFSVDTAVRRYLSLFDTLCRANP